MALQSQAWFGHSQFLIRLIRPNCQYCKKLYPYARLGHISYLVSRTGLNDLWSLGSVELKVFYKSSGIQDFWEWETILVYFSSMNILFSLLHVWIIYWCFFCVFEEKRERKFIKVEICFFYCWRQPYFFPYNSFLFLFLNENKCF